MTYSRPLVGKAVLVTHSMESFVGAHLGATKIDTIIAIIMLGPVLLSGEVSKVFDGRIKMVERGKISPVLPKPFRLTYSSEGMEPLADSIPTGTIVSLSTPIHHALIRTLLLWQNPKGCRSMCVVATAPVPDYASIRIPVLVIAGKG